MPDENDKKLAAGPGSSPESPKKGRLVTAFESITAEEWKDIATEAQEAEEAHDKAIGLAIERAKESGDLLEIYAQILPARIDLRRAAYELQEYLTRSYSEPQDIRRHKRYAGDLKSATDQVKNAAGEYARLSLLHGA